MVNPLKRIAKHFLPGGLRHTAEFFGVGQTFLLVLRTAWAYRRTMKYLLKKRGIRALLSFLYVKIFVPVGEGAGAAVFFLLGPLIRGSPLTAGYPKYVEIEVTTVCNKKCTICEHTYWKDQVIRHLPFEEFRRIVDQFPQLKWVNLTGEGSSFLNKDFMKMIEYLKAKDVAVYFVDHFEDINEEVGMKLIELGVDGIYVSIDGATKETYEEIRVGFEFERVVENLRKFVALKKKMKSPIPELCFRYVVTNTNMHELPKFIELIHSLGDKEYFGDGSRVEFCGLLEFPEIDDLKVEKLPDELIQATVKKAKELGIDVFFAHAEPETHPPAGHCLAWMEPYIMMGGYVLPCCAVLMSNKRTFLRQHSFGVLFEKHFKEIWHSQRYRMFRYMVNKDEHKLPLFCKGCRSYNTAERERTCGIDARL